MSKSHVACGYGEKGGAFIKWISKIYILSGCIVLTVVIRSWDIEATTVQSELIAHDVELRCSVNRKPQER